MPSLVKLIERNQASGNILQESSDSNINSNNLVTTSHHQLLINFAIINVLILSALFSFFCCDDDNKSKNIADAKSPSPSVFGDNLENKNRNDLGLPATKPKNPSEQEAKTEDKP